MSDNSAQRHYWNDKAGETWARYQAQLDRLSAPLGRAAIDELAPRAGERIIDIGCGCGDTSFELGRRVGAAGRIVGIDLSQPMLAVARERMAGDLHTSGFANCRFVEADAANEPLAALFAEGPADALYSRFGVMFFDDPVAAFRNLRAALRPRGRMVFVCWQPLTENTWMQRPLELARALLPPLVPGDPLAPGPFAFADPERVRGLLAEAGWGDIGHRAFACPVDLGTLPEAADLLCRVGPLGAALREHRERLPSVHACLLQALSADPGTGRVALRAATWIWQAQA